MPTDVLTRKFFEPGVKCIAVMMDLGHVVIADQAGALACGMPGRAGRQLAFFNQHHISATLFGQVIQQADTHDSATHNYDTSMTVH